MHYKSYEKYKTRLKNIFGIYNRANKLTVMQLICLILPKINSAAIEVHDSINMLCLPGCRAEYLPHVIYVAPLVNDVR
jgi:hypothetical protein